jgi:drug/metabolite transporter (DMT)-like permease
MDAKKVLAFAAIYLIWGSTYLAIRIGIETMPPFLMAGVRFFLAGLPLYLVLRARGLPRPRLAHWGSALLLGGLMLAGGNGLVTWAEQFVPSGIAAVMIATVPLWMAGLEVWPFRGAALSARALVGLVVGLAGVAILVVPGTGGLGAIDLVGGLALLVAAFSWSLGSLVARRLPVPRESTMTVAIQMIAGGLVLLVWGLLAGEGPTVRIEEISARSLWALAYLVTFGSIVGLGCYVWLMRVCSAAAVSTYAFVNPLVAVLLGWLIGGETLGPRALLATALIVCAVIFLQRGRARQAARARELDEPTGSAWGECCKGESAA